MSVSTRCEHGKALTTTLSARGSDSRHESETLHNRAAAAIMSRAKRRLERGGTRSSRISNGRLAAALEVISTLFREGHHVESTP
jgi:hypothetical protein